MYLVDYVVAVDEKSKKGKAVSVYLKASFWGLLGLIPNNLIFREMKFFETYSFRTN